VNRKKRSISDKEPEFRYPQHLVVGPFVSASIWHERQAYRDGWHDALRKMAAIRASRASRKESK
jgi:hypothetical protein